MCFVFNLEQVGRIFADIRSNCRHTATKATLCGVKSMTCTSSIFLPCYIHQKLILIQIKAIFHNIPGVRMALWLDPLSTGKRHGVTWRSVTRYGRIMIPSVERIIAHYTGSEMKALCNDAWPIVIPNINKRKIQQVFFLITCLQSPKISLCQDVKNTKHCSVILL